MKENVPGIVAIGVWSVTTLIVVFTGDVPPFQLGFMTFFFGFLFLTAWQVLNKENIKSYWTVSPKVYALGLCGFGVHTLSLYCALKMAPPFEANTLNYLWPILLAALAAWFHKHKLEPFHILGLLLGFAGTLLIFATRETQIDLSHDLGWGHGFAILAAFSWASYSVITRKVAFPQGSAAPFFLIIAFAALALHLVYETTIWPGLEAWLFIMFLAISRVSYPLWDYSMKNGDVKLITSLSYFIPLVSTTLFITFGVKPATLGIGLAALLIISGCLLSNFQAIKRLYFGFRDKRKA